MRSQRQKVRHSPQISLNLLGEFMVASFVRRRSILKHAKYPADFIGARYDPAQKAAARYLSDLARDPERLKGDIEADLAAKASKSKWFADRQKLCEQAVSCILALEGALKLDGLDIVLGNNPTHRLEIGGVDVTVMPDLIVQGKGPKFGALKFRYVKTKPITDKWAAYCATLLHQFVEERLSGPDGAVDRRRCNFVDVFAGRVHEAPTNFKELRKDVEAACWHIKELWPSVQMTD